MEQRIGEKIAALRKEKNITQAQLAEYLYLVPQTVSKWEAGNGTPDISLLPRIADFFDISLDDLFGRSSLEHAKDLVLRYSVLRDDHCFQEALSCLQFQMQAVDAALKLEMRDPEELAQERIELEAYKMHLLLQQSRESAGRALEIAEEVAGRTGDMRFRLQRVQLKIEQGQGRDILLECQAQFRTEPCLDTLRLYFEALLLLGRGGKVLELRGTDLAVQELMTPPCADAAAIWLQCARAAAEAEDVEAMESYEEAICQCRARETEYYFLLLLAELYSRKGMGGKCEALKPRLLALLPQVNDNPYSIARCRQAIDALRCNAP